MKCSKQLALTMVAGCIAGAMLPILAARKNGRNREQPAGGAVARETTVAVPEKSVAPEPCPAPFPEDASQKARHDLTYGEQELAKTIIQQNAYWIFFKDRNGAILNDQWGRPKLTPLGLRYYAYLKSAVQSGVQGVEAQHGWAISMLEKESITPAVTATSRRSSPFYPVNSVDPKRIIPDLRMVKVSVLADSISCSQLARFVLNQNRIAESPLKEADAVLVVVRSTLTHPLMFDFYKSVTDLKRDSELQLNISGPNAHVYVFWFNDSLELKEVFHSCFKWKGF